MTFRELIESKIENGLGTLQEEDELEWILRRRLTKKEFKVLIAEMRQSSDSELMSRLNLSSKRLFTIRETIQQKLNQDRIKCELYGIGVDE